MILLLISFIAGILTVLAPCVLPLLPIIVGGSIGGNKNLRKALTVTASLAVSVIAFTLLIKASTVLIGLPQEFWMWFSGLIIFFFGIIMVFPGLWERVPFLAKFSIQSNKVLSSGYNRKDLFGDIIIGAALGPVFSTCSPTYFLVLAAVLPQNFTLGLVYLLSYSIGLSISLLTIAFVGQKMLEKADIAANPRGKLKRLLGVLFIIVAIAIVTGADKYLQTKILDAGFFDVTKLEQKLLEFIPSDQNQENDEVAASDKPSLEEKNKKYKLAPEISSPDGFVNTNGEAITLNDLRGKVVLLDIWTYSCINCQRTLPYINEWYEKYKDQGFVVVGLHTPEFAFERILKNVEKATKDFGIEYPVVLDNDYSTWNAYGNRYWPRKYLIDIDGYIVYDHIGEGGYEETEKAIQKALSERKNRVGVEGEISNKIADPKNKVVTNPNKVKSPEIYFGAFRNERLANGKRGISGTQSFAIPDNISPNLLYLGGSWDITEEYAKGVVGSSVIFKYIAKSVYMVAGSDIGAEISVYKDGEFVKNMNIKDETLYTLINDEYGEHILRFDIKSGELRAFTFTFG